MQNKLTRQYDIIVSLFLAAILVAIFVWWNPIGSKYKLSLESKSKASENELIIYDDLNLDGNSELIRCIKDFIGRPAILVEENNKILFQYNLSGEFVPGEFYHFADFNGNGRKEIFLFTHQNDSIFLNGIDIKTQQSVIKHKYITGYKRYKDRADFSVYNPMTIDLDGDGNKDLIFSFYCAFSHITRMLGSYDITNDLLNLSDKAGSSVYNEIEVFDLDGDGHVEFFGKTPTLGNCSFEYPYSDQHTWLMVYDDQMKYKFPPKKIGTYPAFLQVKPYKLETKNCMASFYYHAGKVDSSYIAIFDSEGELVRKKILNDNANLRSAVFTTYSKAENYYMALYHNDGLVKVYNDQLVKLREFKSKPFLGLIRAWDVDGDSNNEYILTGKNRDELIITRHDFTDPVSFIHESKLSTSIFSNLVRNNQIENLNFQMGSDRYRLEYQVDAFYTFRYLIWLAVFALSFTFLYLLGKIYQYYLRKQYEDEKRITALQVSAIEQQMSPHFTLNILNSIGNLYENHDKQKAQYYFGKYSKLLRISLISSGQISVSLEDELQFTQNYLELERLRLNEGFNFHFIDNQNIPDIKVPKFLIHTFVENAIKHGLFPIHGIREGNISLNMTEENDHLKITIEDDGVGRIKAKNSHILSTGKGLSILDEILELYKRFESKTISYHIEDSYTDREETGTRVIITISNN